LSPNLFNIYSEYLTKETLKKFRDFKIEGQVFNVKYTDDLVLVAKEEMVITGHDK
jgi:hypothetical protein